MLKFNALEKLIVKFKSLLNIKVRNKSKKIVNKKSPNYGTQNIADKIVNNTELSEKTRADVRRLEIEQISKRTYKAKAIFSDGTSDDKFEAHWYGWQNIRGKLPVWTPLGKKNEVNLGKSKFISISAWAKDQPDKEGASENVSKEIHIGDSHGE